MPLFAMKSASTSAENNILTASIWPTQSGPCCFAISQSKQLAGRAFQPKPSLCARRLIASWSSSERVRPTDAISQGWDIQTSQRSSVPALKTNVMALNGERSGETRRPRHGSLIGACGPMIDVFLSSTQPALKTPSVLTKIMQNTCETALLLPPNARPFAAARSATQFTCCAMGSHSPLAPAEWAKKCARLVTVFIVP